MLGNYKITFFSLFPSFHTSEGRHGGRCQSWDNLDNYLDIWLMDTFSQSYYNLPAFSFCLTINKNRDCPFHVPIQVKFVSKEIIEIESGRWLSG